MITFDKIKIITSASNVEVLSPNNDENEKGLDVMTKNGQVVSMKYKITTPFLVDLVIRPIEKEVSIEFTSKILKDQYPMLISSKTISACFEAINRLNVFVLDIDSILKDAYVVKCDITKDAEGIDLSKLKDYINTHIANYNQWTLKPIKNNNNIIIEKNVVTKRNKRRLTIYDKYEEMGKSTNKEFLAWAGNGVRDNFKGVARFELSIATCEAIRKVLHITDTNLSSVLTSAAEPICDLLDDALRPDTNYTTTITKLTDFDKYTTMTYYNWDMEAIEKNARYIYKERYNKNKLLPYQRLLDAHNRNAIFPIPTYDFHVICSFHTPTTTYAAPTPHIPQDYWSAHTLPFFDGDGDVETNHDFITE